MRFVTPAVVDPQKHGLYSSEVEQSASARGNLKHVGKLLQRFGNFVETPKEEFMVSALQKLRLAREKQLKNFAPHLCDTSTAKVIPTTVRSGLSVTLSDLHCLLSSQLTEIEREAGETNVCVSSFFSSFLLFFFFFFAHILQISLHRMSP